MKNPLLLALWISLLAGGCTSLQRADTTQLYLLAGAGPGAPAGTPPKFAGLAFVAPVELASYLDNPGIVLRNGTNHVEFSAQHQWAQPLRDSVSQVLRDDLGGRLGREHVHPFARQRPRGAFVSVQVRLEQFDWVDKKQAVLVATWRLADGDTGATLRVQTTRASRAVKSGGFADAVAALSGTLDDLSREIAGALADR